MGIFNKFLPFATVGVAKIFPTHYCLEEFQSERLPDQQKPGVVKEMSLFDVSLEYMKLCFDLTSSIANLKHQFACQYQVPLLSSDIFRPRFEAQNICNTVESPLSNSQIKETEAHDEEIDFEVITPCDPTVEIDLNVSDALLGINFSELLNLLGVNDGNEHVVSNKARDEEESSDLDPESQDETSNFVKRGSVRDLKYVPSEEMLTIVPLSFPLDFDKDAQRIVEAIKEFMKELTQKLVNFANYLVRATTDERIIDALLKASHTVSSTVKRIIGAIHNLIDKVLVALSLKEVDPKKRAISIAQATADTATATAKAFLKEANGLVAAGNSLTKAAGKEASDDVTNAVNKLNEMSQSVTSHGKQLENEAKMALTFIKTLQTK